MPKRNLEYALTGDESDLRRALKAVDRRLGETEKRTQKLSRSATRAFATLAGAGGIGALAAVGKKAVDTAADIEESLSKNRVLFGKYASDLDEFAQSSATAFGISRQQALEYTGALGNLFATSGVARKESAEFSQTLVELAADMASFNNADPTEVLDALRSGLVGEAEPMRRFGVLLSEGRVKTEAYAKGIATAGSELTEQQKVQARYSLILADSNKSQGDFARTSEGLANQQRVLRAQLSDVTAELGTHLLPAATKAARAFTRFLEQMKSGEGAGGDFARTARKVADVLGDITGFLKAHPALLAAAAAAWGTYKVASLAALAAIKVKTFRDAFAKGTAAAGDEGTAAGGKYARNFGGSVKTWVKGPGQTLFKGLGAALGIGLATAVARQLETALGDAFGIKNVKTRNGIPDPRSSGGIGGGLNALKQLFGQGDPIAGASRVPSRDIVSGVVRRTSGGTAPTASSGRSGGGGGGALALAGVLSAKFGLRLSSGYRSPAQNAAANGVPGSWHTRGSSSNPGAIDMVGSPGSMQSALAWAKQNVSGLAEAMIHNAGSGLHLHLAGPGVMNYNGGGVAGTAPASTGGGSTRRTVDTLTGGRTRTRTGTPSTWSAPYSLRLAEAQAALTIADVTEGLDPGEAAAIMGVRGVQEGRLRTVNTRIGRIKRRLAGRNLTGKQRARLTGVLTSLYDEQASLTSDLRGLTTPAAAVADLAVAGVDNTAELELLRQMVAELTRVRAVNEAQLRSMGQSYADTLSGQIGGRAGLGFQSAGVPGTLARY